MRCAFSDIIFLIQNNIFL